MNNKVERFWERYLAAGAPPVTRYVEAFGFGFTPEDATSIGRLVREGVKTATGWPLWSYEADRKTVPQVGDHWVVVDGNQDPVCIIVTTDVATIPFDEVGEEYARAGGELDRTLATWRPMYWRAIVSECERIGRDASERVPLVMERFEVVYPRAKPTP